MGELLRGVDKHTTTGKSLCTQDSQKCMLLLLMKHLKREYA
ncbi:hypothetical protein CHISP_1580 [Chitinispirillum alkaliphilum]|nr:hypothetical protein CHISP_1580 [Chitinispirillum alkaliphilum]